MHDVLQAVQGYMYPNEVELQWSILIVLYPFITGLVAGAFIVSSLYHVFGRKELPRQSPDAVIDAWIEEARTALVELTDRPGTHAHQFVFDVRDPVAEPVDVDHFPGDPLTSSLRPGPLQA